MATEFLKRLVAREIASGESIADLARRHSYSWKGMKQLSERPDVRRLVAAERQKIDDLADQTRAELVLLGPAAIKNVQAVVDDPDHPKSLETSRFVIGKIVPSRSAVEAHLTGQQEMLADPRVQEELRRATTNIAETMRELSEYYKTHEPDYGKHERVAGPDGKLYKPGELPRE